MECYTEYAYRIYSIVGLLLLPARVAVVSAGAGAVRAQESVRNSPNFCEQEHKSEPSKYQAQGSRGYGEYTWLRVAQVRRENN